ncbi:MAG: hypothetical protein QG670_134 [Thermoproteota archaeon]|nr:hypothetical protein [Thermoproteota archaeon]
MNLILNDKVVAEYLSKLFHNPVSVLVFKELGTGVLGIAYLIEFEINGERKKVVLKTLSQKGFGQDFPADRANTLLYAHTVYNKMENHVKSYDTGAILADGSLTSLRDASEFFILMDFVCGEEYAKDLDRIKETGKLQALDVERTRILADYEAKIHSVKRDDPILYDRRIRDLVGRGDCIMGIIDTYPKDKRTYSFTNVEEFETIEKKCIKWRWKIKDKSHRLCQVHGDIHPFNILWQDDLVFSLLDRSRGEWGEAADDVSCLSINYIFWSLMDSGRLGGSFERLFEFFFRRYMELTGDVEMMEVIQPFFAFRSLVIAHPLFYPEISVENRRKIFNFLNVVLETEKFDYKKINSYLKG